MKEVFAMINERVYLGDHKSGRQAGLRLVPYLPSFVPVYHEWMTDAELLAATESDPLTLEEEMENQLSWLQAEDKLTFILLAPLTPVATSAAASDGPARDDVASCSDGEELTEGHPMSPFRGATVIPFSSSCCRNLSTAAAASEEAMLSPSNFPLTSSCIASADDSCAIVEDGDGHLSAVTRTYPLLRRYTPNICKDLFTGHPLQATIGKTANSIYTAVGDCNLFLLPESDDDDAEKHYDALHENNDRGGKEGKENPSMSERGGGAQTCPVKQPNRTFEVEVMVANRLFHRRGIAETAVRLLMQYAIAVCGATSFVAKVLESNEASIALFTRRLGFTELKRVPVFHEIHYGRRFATESEKRTWRTECLQRSGDGTYVCGPLTPELMDSMTVLSNLPEGYGIALEGKAKGSSSN